MNYRTG